MATPEIKSTPITASIAQPCRWLPTMRPNTLVIAAPIANIEIICTKFDNAVGFSKGCAALALKKPPPLVPSILMATCEATDRKSTRLNSSHRCISYAVFCLKKKKKIKKKLNTNKKKKKKKKKNKK